MGTERNHPQAGDEDCSGKPPGVRVICELSIKLCRGISQVKRSMREI